MAILFKGYAQTPGTSTKSFGLSSLWKTSNENAIYYNDGYVGIGTANPQNILHLHSLERKDNVTYIPSFANFPYNNKETIDNDGLSSQWSYYSTFQMTNRATDSLSSDGFLIELNNKKIIFNLQENGYMCFGSMGNYPLSISPYHNVHVGSVINRNAKLTVFTEKEGGLLINSVYNSKED